VEKDKKVQKTKKKASGDPNPTKKNNQRRNTKIVTGGLGV
jgi:hypothetical protein